MEAYIYTGVPAVPAERTPVQPFERVPDDVLREIFLWCLPEFDWLIGLSPLEAPTLLAHVCRYWRSIALGYPTLWTRIRVELPSRSKQKTNSLRSLNFVSEATSRAQKAPLHLQLLAAGRHAVLPHETLPIVVAPVASTLTRLSLSGIPFESLSALGSGLLFSLERLVLDFTSRTLYPVNLDPVVAFRDAPALRRVFLSGDILRPLPQQPLTLLPLPLHQLTHFFERGCPEPGSCFVAGFLDKCTKLEYLSTEIYNDDADLDEDEALLPIILTPHLKALNISFWPGNNSNMVYPRSIFDRIDAPKLEHFSTDGWELDFSGGDWSSSDIEKFLFKLEGFKNLRSLSLSHSPINTGTLRQIFSSTPFVTTLDAHIYQNYEGFFQVLNWDQREYADVLPNLHTLILEVGLSAATDDHSGHTVDPDSFYTHLIKPRVECDPRRQKLRRILVYGSYGEDIDDDVPFIRLMLDGCVAEGRLELERVVDPGRSTKLNEHWVDRDPRLHDWPEFRALVS